MGNVITVGFNDFKTLSKEKRVYYFNGDDFYDFCFLSDGIIVKSSLVKTEIEDTQTFFSEAMFYNSMELKFRIPNPSINIGDIDMPKVDVNIVDIQDEEVKKTDIQREGVDE